MGNLTDVKTSLCWALSLVYQHDVTGICCWAISLTSALGNTTLTKFRFCCCFMKISRRTSFTEDNRQHRAGSEAFDRLWRNLGQDVWPVSVKSPTWSVGGGVGGPMDDDIFHCKMLCCCKKIYGVGPREGASLWEWSMRRGQKFQ